MPPIQKDFIAPIHGSSPGGQAPPEGETRGGGGLFRWREKLFLIFVFTFFRNCDSDVLRGVQPSVMAGLDPAIQAEGRAAPDLWELPMSCKGLGGFCNPAAWMAGSSPAMTVGRFRPLAT